MDLSRVQSIQMGSAYTIHNEGFFRVIKATGHEADHSPVPNEQTKKDRSFYIALTHSVMVHRGTNLIYF